MTVFHDYLFMDSLCGNMTSFMFTYWKIFIHVWLELMIIFIIDIVVFF